MRQLFAVAAMVGILALAPVALAAGSLPPGFVTDTLAPGGHAKSVPSPPFITDTLAPGGGTQLQSVASSGNGFNWTDATIGAAGAVGTVLVVFGGVLVRLRTRGAVTA